MNELSSIFNISSASVTSVCKLGNRERERERELRESIPSFINPKRTHAQFSLILIYRLKVVLCISIYLPKLYIVMSIARQFTMRARDKAVNF